MFWTNKYLKLFSRIAITEKVWLPHKVYWKEVDEALQKLWAISDYLYGKRLAYFIRDSLPSLEKFGEIEVNDDTRKKLLNMSPATIDRRLS
jgi:hypothetical protein